MSFQNAKYNIKIFQEQLLKLVMNMKVKVEYLSRDT